MPCLEVSLEKLRSTMAKAPVLRLVAAHGDDEVVAIQVTLLLQTFSEGGIQCLLGLCITTLLEDLDEHQAICALQAEIGVLADELVRVVLRDDLDAICQPGSAYEESDNSPVVY